MNKISLFSSLFLLIGNHGIAQGQNIQKATFTIVDKICFTENYKEYIKVPSGIDVTNLHLQDKLKFKNKSFTNHHIEYLDNTTRPVKEIQTISHKNIHPKWYNKAYLRVIDAEYTKTFFNTNNNVYKGGWTGELINTFNNSTYTKDNATGEAYLVTPHTEDFKNGYINYSEAVDRYGLLTKYIYNLPTTHFLNQLETLDYSISYSGNVIKANNGEVSLIWDDDEKMIITQYFEDGHLRKTSYAEYEHIPIFNSFLLTKILVITSEKFIDGQCYEHVTETIYEGYGNNCNPSARKNFSEKTSEAIVVYPNPSSSQITIKLPAFNDEVNVSITDLQGRLLMQRKITTKTEELSINVNEWNDGVYIVKVYAHDKIYSSKFIKQ